MIPITFKMLDLLVIFCGNKVTGVGYMISVFV